MNMEGILENYYASNAGKLRRVVDKILVKFGGIAQKDEDDFYSLANEVFLDVMKRYDGEKNFDVFLYSCLSNRIRTEITRRNRMKRQCDQYAISMDALICEDGANIEKILVSDFNVEQEVEEKNRIFEDERIEEYLKRLSGLQQKILEYKMQDMPKNEIVQHLGISDKVYDQNMEQLKSYDKTRILFQSKNTKETIEKREGTMTMQTSEISKNTSYAVSSLIKKLDGYSIRGDHSLQRNSGQWNNLTKSEYICALLHGYPVPAIILAEQVTPKGTINWLIDGKQRSTNASCFEKNCFKISRSVERPVIQYQTIRRDDTGKIQFDITGAPLYENREYDVRGKYYSDLPEELKERFNDYAFPVVQYLNCSDEDIEYHIRRYNAAKPMSAAQKGITHLGEQFARVVKDLTEHTFFKEKGNYRISEFSNGTIDRVVIESIMAIYFLPDWKKRQEDMCRYLKNHVKMEHFHAFSKMMDRLSAVMTEDVAEMFHSRDSFLWFALFAGWSEMGLSDAEFIAFMRKFKSTLHSKTVDGITYDSLNEKSTKDKTVVIRKLKVLEELVKENRV